MEVGDSRTSLNKRPEKVCDILASSINSLQPTGIRTRKGVLGVKVSVSNPSWEKIEPASPNLWSSPSGCLKLECLAQVMVDADLAKSAARTLQAPKARGGSCDPREVRSGSEALRSGLAGIPSVRAGEGACTLGHRSVGAADLGMTLRRGDRFTTPRSEGFKALPHYSSRWTERWRMPAQPVSTLSASISMHRRGCRRVYTLPTQEGIRLASLRTAPARARPRPAPFSLPRPVSTSTAARGSGGGCGLRARRL